MSNIQIIRNKMTKLVERGNHFADFMTKFSSTKELKTKPIKVMDFIQSDRKPKVRIVTNNDLPLKEKIIKELFGRTEPRNSENLINAIRNEIIDRDNIAENVKPIKIPLKQKNTKVHHNKSVYSRNTVYNKSMKQSYLASNKGYKVERILNKRQKHLRGCSANPQRQRNVES
mmetsp:Transcript_9626/g.8472  ORF Transcript_9626/g.8472 Transcript_9626/m.8472 type:complete len:172 (+) Transcript_9626:411-926(+)